jgi:hypothetical protein
MPLAINDLCPSLQFGLCCYFFLNIALYSTEDVTHSPAFVHVPALLSPSNALAAGLVVLAVPIAAIPFETQSLFCLRVLNGTHTGVSPSAFCKTSMVPQDHQYPKPICNPSRSVVQAAVAKLSVDARVIANGGTGAKEFD